MEQIESHVVEIEARLDDLLGRLERLRSELKRLNSIEESLLLLRKHELKADCFGDFENISVRGGFMNRAFATSLQEHIEGTSMRFASWPDRREEDFVVIFCLNRDKLNMEEMLKRLNFVELILPSTVIPEPLKALDENRSSLVKAQQEINKLEQDVRGICEEFQKKEAGFGPVVRWALGIEDARATFSRTDKLSLVLGWIPAVQQEPLRRKIEASTNGKVFLKFDDPGFGDHPPARLRNRGVAKYFELLTSLRGMPQYREVDPTSIVMVLFTIMYGMMFGDVGQGILLFAIGVIFNRLHRSFLGIPSRAMGKLGGILATCGISAAFFGVLYGESFLSEVFPPIFVNPIQGQTTMIVMALLFGVAQLFLGIILKIVNQLRARATIEAAFGGVRLVYYAAGVALAVKYAASLSLAIFTENLWLTSVAIASLVILFVSPTIEGAIRHDFRLGECIMKGTSEFIETFLSYLTNSISYVRLAAFAIAHSALGVSVVILTATIGAAPSFIVMNFLAMTIEVLGVFIQCMRLTYYEFFTKFYSGNGVPYRPFSLPLSRKYA